MNITLAILVLSTTAINSSIPRYQDVETSVYSEMPAITTIAPHGLICPKKGPVMDDEYYVPTSPSPSFFNSYQPPARKRSVLGKIHRYVKDVAYNFNTADSDGGYMQPMGYHHMEMPTPIYFNSTYMGQYVPPLMNGAPAMFIGPQF